MSREHVGNNGIILEEGDIFVSSESSALTVLGSRLEGINSIRGDLLRLSGNGMSEKKFKEWRIDIEGRFGEVEKVMGIGISRIERESLLRQHRAIVEERKALLTKLPSIAKI